MVVLGLGLGLGLGLPSRSEAARIGTFVTAQDRSRPLLLSETGVPIQLRSLTHPDPVLPQGTVPAYMAFPLHGNGHLPSAIPTLTTAPRAGKATVGPLNLDPLVRAQLNAALETSRLAIVETPHRHYAVGFVPHYVQTQPQPASTAGTSPSSGNGNGNGTGTGPSAAQTITSSPRSASQPDPTIQGIPLSELAQWVKLGSSNLIHWTSVGVHDLTKSLDMGNSKATATKPSSSLAAQVLAAPLAEGTSSTPLPAPVPEPSTWLVFGLLLGAAGLRQWMGKTV